MPIKDTKGYPTFHPDGRRRKIKGRTYYHVEVIGGHGVTSTWLLAETIKQIRKDGLIR